MGLPLPKAVHCWCKQLLLPSIDVQSGLFVHEHGYHQDARYRVATILHHHNGKLALRSPRKWSKIDTDYCDATTEWWEHGDLLANPTEYVLFSLMRAQHLR